MTVSTIRSGTDRSHDAYDRAGLETLIERGDQIIGALHATRKPRLFIISGPSGVGKDTVIDRLRDRYPDAFYTVTLTTRPPREKEIDGVDYIFVDTETFERRQAAGELLESAKVYDNWYGVPRPPVTEALARGQDVIIKIDVQGAATIRQAVQNVVSIFLAPESMSELLRRLDARKSEDAEKRMRRFRTASRELARAWEFDYVVFNRAERVDETLERIFHIIGAERRRLHQEPVQLP